MGGAGTAHGIEPPERIDRTANAGPDNPAYNCAAFPPESDAEDFARFIGHLPVGSAAPDFEATRLEDGAPVRLSEYWRQGICVLEFRAIT